MPSLTRYSAYAGKREMRARKSCPALVYSEAHSVAADRLILRKGVKTMTYSKPDITVLGEAAWLILGSSGKHFEPDKMTPVGASLDGELDE